MSETAARRLILLFVAGLTWAPLAHAAGSVTPDAGAQASTAPYVLDARAIGDNQQMRFVADLSANVDAAVFPLADPYRIVIDLPDVRFVLPDTAGTTARGFVTAFRYGSISPGKSRIVIDLNQPVAIEKQFNVPPGDGQPARLVVSLVPTTREAFLAAAESYRKAHATADSTDTASAAAAGDEGKPLIVLDPGHGGIDLGARSDDGTLEKDVVLSFAKVLGAKLLATGRYRVAYTRDDDTFISLGERVRIAQRDHADLFISVHANSFPGSAVRGAIVYTVSDKASDTMAAAQAAAENESDALAGIDVAAEDSDQVKTILADLTQRETRNFGVAFAQALIKNMAGKTRMFKIPHKEASFKVLEAPDVPSALIELGYLTTAADEKLLVSPDWQSKTADGMVAGIDSYFRPRVEAATR